MRRSEGEVLSIAFKVHENPLSCRERGKDLIEAMLLVSSADPVEVVSCRS
jgi:hypothetical protein